VGTPPESPHLPEGIVSRNSKYLKRVAEAGRDTKTVHRTYYRELEAEGIRADRDWQSFDPSGNVYLIGCKALNFYKIGLTRDKEVPDKRFKTIQQGVPFDLDYLKYWFVTHARSFEKLLHYEFQSYRIRGEWFKFTPEDLLVITARIKELSDKIKVVKYLSNDEHPQEKVPLGAAE
jgi:hypothetical protein